MRSEIASTRRADRESASSDDEVALDGVARLRWPEAEATRAALERSRRPRLLLLAEGVTPPPSSDDLEDWTRERPDSDEVKARIETLAWRARSRTDLRLSGRHLHRGSRQVSLTAAQCLVVAPLIRLAGQPVPRAVLANALQIAGTVPGPSAVRSLLTRLDRTVAPLGLRVWLLSGQAVMLEVQDAPPT